MTSTPPVGTVGPPKTNATSNTSGTSSTSGSAEDKDKDMFLKLLIAQMKNQDPSNPTDSTQYLSQMAQFTQVEKLGDLATAQASMLATNQMTAAVTMIGKSVNYGVGDDAASGTVTGVTVVQGVPQLLIGSTAVDLTTVTKVAPVAATPAATPAPTPSPTPAPASS